MSTQDKDNELSPEERKRFESLPRHRTPPPHLEETIMSELHKRGLLKTGAQSGWNWITKIAAVLALLVLGGAGGYFAGKSETASREPIQKNPLYVLLIRESPMRLNGENLVAEYGKWAAGVYKAGRFITGEKLRGTGRILSNSGESLKIEEVSFVSGDGQLGGYFIIEAKDYDDAVQIASQCPHLKYGGIIELREIEPT